MPSFRLITVLWAFALVAAAMATFGGWGILAAIFVFLFWATALSSRKLTFMELLVIVAIVGMLIGLLLPGIDTGTSHRLRTCQNSLRRLATAVFSYTVQKKRAPASVSPRTKLLAPRSWRVQILPWLDQLKIYNMYRHERNWDAPANAVIAGWQLDFFQCPSDARVPAPSPHTSYFAVLGPDTAWPDGGGRQLADFTDGADCTILLVEAPGRNVSWAEPRDLSFDEVVSLLTLQPTSPATEFVHFRPRDAGLFYKAFGESQMGLNAAFADGRVEFIPVPLPKDLAQALLTVNGGEPIDRATLNRLFAPQLDYARCYAFAAFVLLALAPGIRLLRRRMRNRVPAADALT